MGSISNSYVGSFYHAIINNETVIALELIVDNFPRLPHKALQYWVKGQFYSSILQTLYMKAEELVFQDIQSHFIRTPHGDPVGKSSRARRSLVECGPASQPLE